MSESKEIAEVATQQSLMAMMGGTMSPALAIFLDDRLFQRCKEVSNILAQAEGVTPQHLINKPQACFSVVSMALIWKLSPMMVAQSTFAIPGSGKIGYEGKLCQAILENSGKIEGNVKFEYFGEWDKILGKFDKKKNDRGKEYAVRGWTDKDEEGLGVIVRAQIHGEVEPREFSFLLKQAFPRNSTLWATDPKTQLGYTAVRRFGSVAAPGIFMGVPFDREDFAGDGMVDITPEVKEVSRPAKPSAKKRAAASEALDDGFKGAVAQDAPKPNETVIEETGEVVGADDTTQEPGETTEPEQENDATQEPERTEEEPAQQTESTQTAPAKDPEAPAKAAEPKQQPAADGPKEMTEQEAKLFRGKVEKDIIKFTGTAADFAKFKDSIMTDYRRLKAFDSTAAEKIAEMFKNKMKALKDREAATDDM